jgi:hypothetical protein
MVVEMWRVEKRWLVVEVATRRKIWHTGALPPAFPPQMKLAASKISPPKIMYISTKHLDHRHFQSGLLYYQAWLICQEIYLDHLIDLWLVEDTGTSFRQGNRYVGGNFHVNCKCG